jgi:hypothetical protein
VFSPKSLVNFLQTGLQIFFTVEIDAFTSFSTPFWTVCCASVILLYIVVTGAGSGAGGFGTGAGAGTGFGAAGATGIGAGAGTGTGFGLGAAGFCTGTGGFGFGLGAAGFCTGTGLDSLFSFASKLFASVWSSLPIPAL